MSETDDYAGVVASRLGAKFGAVDRAPRKRSERLITRTPKERQARKQRVKVRTATMTFKTTPEFRDRLREAADAREGVTMTSIIEAAVNQYLGMEEQ